MVKILLTALLTVLVLGACAKLKSGEGGDTDGGVSVTWRVDDGSKGLIGDVYDLQDASGTAATLTTLDLSGRTPLSDRILVENLDVPSRLFNAGFPGASSLTSWFGVRFRGNITLPEANVYTFRLFSDDGSQLYINDELLIEHGSQHPASAKDSSAKTFSSVGPHTLRVDYFQGPPQQIAIQLYVKKQGEADFSIVPASWLDRP